MNFFKNRRLKIDILTIFLVIYAFSFLFITFYTYSKSTKSIHQFSKGTINRVSSLIIEKTECLLWGAQKVVRISQAFLSTKEDASIHNERLATFILDEVKFHPDINALYFGAPNGDHLAAINLNGFSITHYIGDPSKPLPPGTVYALRSIDYSTSADPPEQWQYLDTDFKVVGSETIPKTTFDPRVRPWYKGAVAKKGYYWTDVFTYTINGMRGIAVANPIYDKKGELICVVSANVSLKVLSDFLKAQRIGTHGKAAILSRSGKILIPDMSSQPKDLLGISEEVIALAYKQYTADRVNNFDLVNQGFKYLASVQDVPIAADNGWLIVIIAPLSDFFSDLIRTQYEVAFFSIIILILAGILVVYFSKRISDPIVLLAKETDRISRLDLESNIRVKSNIREINLLDTSVAALRIAMRSFGRYIPKEIVKQLIQKGQEITIGGEKKRSRFSFPISKDLLEFQRRFLQKS